VPERSRKDQSKLVAVPIAGPTAKDTASDQCPPSLEAAAEGSGAADEAPLKRRRLSAAEADRAPLPPSSSPVVSVRHLRITVLATRSPTTTCMQLAEVALRCREEVLSMAGFRVESPNSQSPLSEGPEKLLLSVGKFLDANFRIHGQTVIVLTAPQQIDVEDIAFRTSNDNPSRDPVHLVVDGSRDGQEWRRLLDSGPELPVPGERKVWTPWFGLEETGQADEQAEPVSSRGAERFYCPVRPCCSTQASIEGYLVEGKLLRHMLQAHPRSTKTAELALKLRGSHVPRSRHAKKGLRRTGAEEELPVSPSAAPGAASGTAGSAADAASLQGPPSAASPSSSSSSSSDEEEVGRPAPPAPAVEGGDGPESGRNDPATPLRSTAADARACSLGALTPSPLVPRTRGLSQQMRSALMSISGADATEVVEAVAAESPDEILEALAGMSPLPPASPESSLVQPGATCDAVPIAELDGLRRHPPFEGTVIQRWPNSDGGFRVRLHDPSGSVDVAFFGRAAEVYRDEPSLKEGSRVRIEGYDIAPVREEGSAGSTGRRYELLIGSVHPGVSVAALGVEALTPLSAIEDVPIGSSMSVQAIVQYDGKFPRRHGAPPKQAQPLEGDDPTAASFRALVLRQGKVICSLVLRGETAEGGAAELVGKRVIVRGARVIEFKGKRHLSGWRHLEVCAGN